MRIPNNDDKTEKHQSHKKRKYINIILIIVSSIFLICIGTKFILI